MDKESNVWWAAVAGLIFFLMGVIDLGFAIVNGSPQQIIGAVALILPGIALPALSYRWYIVQRRREQRRLAVHQAALAGDTSLAPLADPQPLPNAEALPLPFTIKTRPNWLTIIPACGLATLSLWGFFEGMLLQSPDPSGVSGFFPIGIIVAILFFGILIFAAAQASRQKLEVTDEALMCIGPDFQRVPWNGIKLFAVTTGGREQPAKRYELASSSYSFPLRRLRRRDIMRLSMPATSFDEYDRQMEALLALIAAKTGLPLYDLR